MICIEFDDRDTEYWDTIQEAEISISVANDQCDAVISCYDCDEDGNRLEGGNEYQVEFFAKLIVSEEEG